MFSPGQTPVVSLRLLSMRNPQRWNKNNLVGVKGPIFLPFRWFHQTCAHWSSFGNRVWQCDSRVQLPLGLDAWRLKSAQILLKHADTAVNYPSRSSLSRMAWVSRWFLKMPACMTLPNCKVNNTTSSYPPTPINHTSKFFVFCYIPFAVDFSRGTMNTPAWLYAWDATHTPSAIPFPMHSARWSKILRLFPSPSTCLPRPKAPLKQFPQWKCRTNTCMILARQDMCHPGWNRYDWCPLSSVYVWGTYLFFSSVQADH